MRSRAVATLLFLAGLACTALGALLRDGSQGILDADAFAERTVQSLHDPRVGALVADRITDAVLREKPDLTAVRPIIQATAAGLVGSQAFGRVLASALREAHDSALSEAGRGILVSLPDVGVLVRSALASLNPELASRVPSRLMTLAAHLEPGPGMARLGTALRAVRLLGAFSTGLLLLGPLLLAGAVALARDRRRALVRTGVGLLGAALLLVALLPAGRLVAATIARSDLEHGAILGLWRSYFGGLTRWGMTIGGIGLVLASAGTSLLEAADPIAHARRALAALATVPAQPSRRATRALVLLALGFATAASPRDAAVVLLTLAGLGVAYVGLRELFREILGAAPEIERAAVVARSAAWGNRLAVVVAIALPLGIGAVVLQRQGQRKPVSTTVTACNGAPELCDRTLDRVAFPATHNSMANEDMPGWLFPEHEAGIPRQLEEGIRALLIDVHAGIPTEGEVLTNLDVEGRSREKIAQVIGDKAVAAALRIRERLAGKAGGAWEPFLCHGYCETGHFPLVPALEGIRDFLVANPDEVVLMVIEDYIPAERIAEAFERSRLAEFVYHGPQGPPWPTLRELITGGGRVVVFLESGAPGVPWLLPAFASIQETPYTFHTPAEFSCRPNRGGSSGSLFQINHWIETEPAPLPSNAAIANSYDFLLDRARTCSQERGHPVNVLAVDFYRTGDLLRVVRALNGLDSPPGG
jgi:hypothetical protein